MVDFDKRLKIQHPHEAHPLAARHLAEYHPWMIRPVAPNAGSK
jgi:hypothetical protein